MRILLFCSLLLAYISSAAQRWVDTNYSYQLTAGVVFGNAVDFAGNLRSLDMDICMPVNDVAPACGRPLLVMVHGGAFISGTKNDIVPQAIMKDFAKRGYVTASVNYRLGMFETSSNVHCNIGNGWDCLNMADTAEWLRANYRAMQDVKGAIRYMIVHAADYDIDARNVFVAGESAGAITTLNIAYLDDNNEKYAAAYSLPDATAPNAIYDGQCVQTYGFDTSIASMALLRPDLGSIEGDLNPGGGGYTIKAIGSFYGGMFANLFTTNNYTTPPAAYIFHQPNDLLVPYASDRVLAGYAYCAVTMGGCQYIINRPYIAGGKGMVSYINALPVADRPQFIFDSTNNNADCLQQINDPSAIGHAIDNYELRTLHMAQLFASKIDTTQPCGTASVARVSIDHDRLHIYPNPVSDMLHIDVQHESILSVSLTDLQGREILINSSHPGNDYSLAHVKPGIYLLRVMTDHTLYISRITRQ